MRCSPVTIFAINTCRRLAPLILLGIGVGLSFQTAIIAAQTILSGPDISVGSSAMILGQTLGGAIILCVAQNVFQNTLVSELASRAPRIDVGTVTAVGASRVGTTLTALLGADAASIV